VWEPVHDDLEIIDRFAGAQPVALCAPHYVIAELMAASQSALGCGALSRLRDLRFSDDFHKASAVAAVLRAAPELRRLYAGAVAAHGRVEWHNDPAFAGLVHHKLRSLQFRPYLRSMPEKFCFAAFDELQAHHFPRLRAFTME
jgi:hypothetical protein